MYIFHSIHTEKTVWQAILSQANIYNIFPATVPFNNVKKILEGASIRKTSKYIPQSALWISRLFIELASRNEKVCLTLDCSNTNRDGPGRFHTEADNPEFQSCYFNSANYNEFICERIKAGGSKKSFQFKIIELKSRTNSELTFDASEELRNLTNMTQAQVDKKQLLEVVQKAAQEVRSYYHHSSQYPLLKKVTDQLEKELNLDFLLDDNTVKETPPPLPPKKKTRKRSNNYSPTKVKA